MKIKSVRIRFTAMAIAFAMLMTGFLGSCHTQKPNEADTVPSTDRESDSSGSIVTSPESLPVETAPETGSLETESGSIPADPFANTILLASGGQSEYRIIVPDYAADWELEAAASIAGTLSSVGATVSIAVDSQTPPSDREIVVGYTNRNSELEDDFFLVGPGGYHILVQGSKLFLGANTEDGMYAALERLASDLITDGDRLAIKEGYVCLAKDTSEPSADPVLSGSYADSIAYASKVANGVQGSFTNGHRKGFMMSNLNMSLTSDLTTGGHSAVTALTNAYGIPYIRNTMSAYVVTSDGIRYYSSDSSASGRMNIYRYGVYYYEAHILGQDFGASRVADTTASDSYDVLGRATGFPCHDVTVKKDKTSGLLTISVKSNADPYVNFTPGFSVSTEQYDAVLITMRTEVAASAQIYFAAGSHSGIDGTQIVSFNIVPGEAFRTYLVPLSTAQDFTGNITALRLDVGTDVGEIIEISEIKLVKTIYSGVPTVVLDRTLHTYSDKLNQVLHFVTTGTVDNMTAYGMETAVEASRVNSLLVVDGNGEHTSLSDVDWSTAVAVAFDIDRAGVFGYILTTAEGVGGITVREQDGFYIIDQQQQARASYSTGKNFYIGQRIYTDMTHSFEDFRQAVYEEQHPLENLTVTSGAQGAKVVGYDPLRGAYRFDVSGIDFSEAYRNPDLQFRVDASIDSDGLDRTIYVYTHTASGGLECAALLDSEERLLPMLLQVCKNFKGENEEPLFDKGDASYGEVYFPLVIKAGETVNFSVLNLYQNWGKYPLKQISSIQFIAPYYHLSTGVTETNCIAPFYVYGKDRWTLPDFRSMSAPLWASQPQHTSAGRLYFLEYTDAEGNTYASESTVDRIVSSGPVYADIWMSYLSDDGRIAVDYRHMEMPQTDENRTYYEIRMKVLEDISFRSFREDFTIFSMDGRSVRYQQFSYLDENNQPIITDAAVKAKEIYHTLGSQSPFIAYSYVPGNHDYVNMALIVKDWSITIGGKAYTGALVATDAQIGSLNTCRLTLDLDEVTLKAGDEININLILLPWGSQETAKDDISHVLHVREDTCLSPYCVTVTTGSLIQDAYLPQILADHGVAEFTVSGGDNNMAVRVYGFDSYEKPIIQEYVDGVWVPYNVASVNGYDGYAVYYDGDGTYSFAFIINMDDGVERTFRVR